KRGVNETLLSLIYLTRSLPLYSIEQVQRDGKRWALELDDYEKQLAEQVGTAINDSVQESASVAAAIERLREAGYDLELTLRLEIGLRPHATEDSTGGQTGSLEFTDEDVRILQAMKIKIEPEE